MSKKRRANFSKVNLAAFIIIFAGIGGYIVWSALGAQAPISCTKYTATTGSDSNPGTQSAPFKTIQKLANSLSAGQIGCVEDGTYHESVVVSHSGTAGNYITITAQHHLGAKLEGNNNSLVWAFDLAAGASYVNFENFDISAYSGGGVGDPNNAGVSHFSIRYNYMHDIGNFCDSSLYGITGVYAENSSNIVIDGNTFTHIGRIPNGQDGCTQGDRIHDHPVYLGTTSNVVISNNIFYNNTAGWAIQLYGGPTASNDYQIYNNTFAYPNPSVPGYILIGSPGLANASIRNNIFYKPNSAAIYVYNVSVSNVTVSNNDIYSGNVATGNTAGLSISGNSTFDPLFVSPTGYDFHLQSGSPAIDSGATLSSVTADHDGNPRPQGAGYDLGAYEYNGTSGTTPPSTDSVTSSIKEGDVLRGTVHWTAAVTGNVQSVEFWADNTRLSLQTSAPYAYDLDTTKYSDGAHIVGVAWTDSTGTRHPASPPTDVTINNAPTISSGDLNNDGRVDIQDLSILLVNFGKSGVAGDLNNDGRVNIIDLSILLSHYGE